VLRAYCEYAFQLKVVPSRSPCRAPLRAYPDAARQARSRSSARSSTRARASSMDARLQRLEQVRGVLRDAAAGDALADDRALRRLMACSTRRSARTTTCTAVRSPPCAPAACRTSAFKFLGELLQPLVRTRLRAEVWVQSARMAGIHMRMGKVSRGGLRHSDRPDDFRTEVLGLVRTQAVKNAVIVPAGSKGGFVTRLHPADPRELAAEVEAQYRTLIRGLLDITDNLRANELVRPHRWSSTTRPIRTWSWQRTRARRSSPTSRTPSQPITASGWTTRSRPAAPTATTTRRSASRRAARGSACAASSARWAATSRRSRSRPIGIGDMSGDVFGNGMLLSREIRLLAAFDHRHIFVDPNPDAAKSYEERQRLFAARTLELGDYDRVAAQHRRLHRAARCQGDRADARGASRARCPTSSSGWTARR
jgi:glutamate dehydrogenase